MPDTHLFGDSGCGLLLHLWGGGGGKVAGLGANGVVLFREGVGSDGGLGGFSVPVGVLLVLIVRLILSIKIPKRLISNSHIILFLINVFLIAIPQLIIKHLIGQLLELIIKIGNLLDILIRSAIRYTQLRKKLYSFSLFNL